MRITALTASGTDMFKVFVDSRPLGLVTTQSVLELQLRVGLELNAQQYNALCQAVDYATFYSLAIRFCLRRMHSRAEVAAYLQQHDCPKTVTDLLVARLQDAGLIDEARLATAMIHDLGLQRPVSRVVLKQKLQAKQIDPDLIEDALLASGIDDERALLALIDKKRQQASYRDRKKLFRYLVRQGFDYSLITKHLGSPY